MVKKSEMSHFHPILLVKIFEWKNRAQLAVAMNRLDVVKKRHMEKFYLQRSHLAEKQAEILAGTAQLCSQCAENLKGFQVTTDDLNRLERAVQSLNEGTGDALKCVQYSVQTLKEEMQRIKMLITTLLPADKGTSRIQIM